MYARRREDQRSPAYTRVRAKTGLASVGLVATQYPVFRNRIFILKEKLPVQDAGEVCETAVRVAHI
jgi:hypothetical protein